MSKYPARVKGLSILYWILCILPILMCFAAFPFLNETLALHFGAGGQPDKWGDKSQLILIVVFISSIGAVMFWLTSLAAKNSRDPVRDRMISLASLIVMMVVMNVVTFWAIAWNLPQLKEFVEAVDWPKVVYFLVGASSIALGVVHLGQPGPPLSFNMFPWDFSGSQWLRFRRLTSSALVAAGVLEIIICIFVLSGQFATVFTLLLFSCVSLGLIVLGFKISR